MCFVKTLVHKKVQLESAFAPTLQQKSQTFLEQSTPCEISETKSDQKLQLFSLFQGLLVANSAALMQAQMTINQMISNIQNVDLEVKELSPENQEKNQKSQVSNETDSLIEEIFGPKNYRYKLELDQQFFDVLYKQRNFNLNVHLVDISGQSVRNANVIPICIGVLTTTGQWINENRQGQTLIKGKSQVQLYRGRADFQKVYIREVSRHYPEGKINLIVYAKHSMMKCLNQADFEQKVNDEEIQPLLIKDLCVKAKKK